MRVRVNRLLVGILFVGVFTGPVFGFNVETLGKIKLLDNNDVFLQIPVGIAVTEDNVFLVVDFKAANVKIYRNDGKLMEILGRQGYGPNEFAQPLHCYYSNSTLFIDDVGQKKIFMYKRKGKFKFVRSKTFSFMALGDDFYLEGNTLYTVGEIKNTDGVGYSNLAFDPDTGKHLRYFLPVHEKLGLGSQEEYRNKIHSKSKFSILDRIGFFDFFGDYAYYSCMIDLKIFKINKKDGTYTTFGKKTDNYIQPYVNGKIIEAARAGNREYIREQKAKMSFVRQILTTNRHVLLVYGKRNKGVDSDFMVQFYNFAGEYITEAKMPGNMGFNFWLDKQTNILYTTLIDAVGEGEDDIYYMMKYKITED